MKNQTRYLSPFLAVALCASLLGCSNSSPTPVSASPKPASSSTTESVAPTKDGEPMQAATSGSRRQARSESYSSDDSTSTDPTETMSSETPEKNPLTVMNLEPGTSRLFQNAPNDAERERKQEYYKARRKARLAAEEKRRAGIRDGQNVPLLDDGIKTITN